MRRIGDREPPRYIPSLAPCWPLTVTIGRGARRRNDVNESEIEAKVIDIVAEQMSVDKGEVSRDTSFVNDLNADSLDTVELVMELEDEFETSIPDEEAEKIQTVGQAIEFIMKAQAQKS